MKLESLIKVALDYFFRTSFKRVLTLMIILGVSLLAFSWIDVVALFLEKVDQQEQSGSFVTFTQLSGVGMICVGFVGHLCLYIIENHKARQSVAKQEKKAARKLVGHIEILIEGFRDPTVIRDAGYYNPQILICRDAAREFQETTSLFDSDKVLSTISNPRFDASKEKPYFNLKISDIELFIKKIKKHYGIK